VYEAECLPSCCSWNLNLHPLFGHESILESDFERLDYFFQDFRPFRARIVHNSAIQLHLVDEAQPSQHINSINTALPGLNSTGVRLSRMLSLKMAMQRVPVFEHPSTHCAYPDRVTAPPVDSFQVPAQSLRQGEILITVTTRKELSLLPWSSMEPANMRSMEA
jgi:hypothetical protein